MFFITFEIPLKFKMLRKITASAPMLEKHNKNRWFCTNSEFIAHFPAWHFGPALIASNYDLGHRGSLAEQPANYIFLENI